MCPGLLLCSCVPGDLEVVVWGLGVGRWKVMWFLCVNRGRDRFRVGAADRMGVIAVELGTVWVASRQCRLLWLATGEWEWGGLLEEPLRAPGMA
jgi:hypothetical protein